MLVTLMSWLGAPLISCIEKSTLDVRLVLLPMGTMHGLFGLWVADHKIFG